MYTIEADTRHCHGTEQRRIIMQTKYMSTSQAAEKWGVSPRQVQRLIAEGRISGIMKFGHSRLIPIDTEKPDDPRRLSKPSPCSAPLFTLPRRCPQLIFTTLLNKPGTGDAVVESLSYDSEAQTLFAAQLAYFRGETECSRALVGDLSKRTARPDVLAGCCFVLCLCAMYDGDYEAWKSAYGVLKAFPCPSREYEVMRDFNLAGLDSGLYSKESFPEWFCRGVFDPLPGDSYPLARFLYLKYLLLAKGDPGISVLCGPIISQNKLEGALLSEIYCRILTSIGFHDRGDMRSAAEQLDAAVALALPDRLFSPFAEYRNELGLLLDERLNAADKNALSAVRELHTRLIVGWTVLFRKIRKIDYSYDLTQRERHAAKLAAKGLSNGEIAQRMQVSVNSVKRYISVAMQKTGTSNRAELSKAILFGGKSLP